MQAGFKLLPGDLGILLKIADDDGNLDWLLSRAVALLGASFGDDAAAIARQTGVDPQTIRRWRSAYARDGFAGVFHDWPRPEPVVEPDAELDRDLHDGHRGADDGVRPTEPDHRLKDDRERREYLRLRREALGTRRRRPREWDPVAT